MEPNSSEFNGARSENPRSRPVSPESRRPEFPTTTESAAHEIASVFSDGQASLVSRVGERAARSRSKPPPRDDPLFIRKTLIPILLTLGIVLAGAGALLLSGGQDNALPELFPRWMPIALFVLAAIFLILAGLNMMSIRLLNRNGP